MWRKWREHYRVTPLVGLMKVVEDLFQVHFLYLGSCRLRVYPTDLQELPHQALQALHVPDHQLHRPAAGGVQCGSLSSTWARAASASIRLISKSSPTRLSRRSTSLTTNSIARRKVGSSEVSFPLRTALSSGVGLPAGASASATASLFLSSFCSREDSPTRAAMGVRNSWAASEMNLCSRFRVASRSWILFCRLTAIRLKEEARAPNSPGSSGKRVPRSPPAMRPAARPAAANGRSAARATK